MRLSSLQSPLRAFDLCGKSRAMVEYNEYTGYFEYKEKFDSPKKREKYSRKAYVQYFIFGMLACAAIIFAPNILDAGGLAGFAYTFFMLTFLLPAAWFMMVESTKEIDSKNFMSFLENDPKYELFNNQFEQETEVLGARHHEPHL